MTTKKHIEVSGNCYEIKVTRFSEEIDYDNGAIYHGYSYIITSEKSTLTFKKYDDDNEVHAFCKGVCDPKHLVEVIQLTL